MPAIGKALVRRVSIETRRDSVHTAPGLSVSPHNLGLGKRARSKTRTRRPARDRTIAASDPAGPAPTITTSSMRALRCAEDERGVLRPESEAVTQGRGGPRRTALQRQKVEIAVRVGVGQVDGGWEISARQG